MVAVSYQICLDQEHLKILSIRVLEWLVILIGSKIKGINKLEAREYKNSFVRLFIIIQEVNIKMLKLEHRFLFFRDILQ